MKAKHYITDILIGILFTLVFITTGLVLAIFFRPLYYFDIDYLNIVANSGFNKETILTNYNALIDYCSPFFTGRLQFPTFPASENALLHFREVKHIFNLFIGTGVISLLLLFPLLRYKHMKKEYSYLRTSSILSLALPAVVAFGCAINFDRAFILFHKLFFRNDYWLFDYTTDPVILILPDTFFLHCAMVIIAFVILGSLLLWVLSKKLIRNSNK